MVTRSVSATWHWDAPEFATRTRDLDPRSQVPVRTAHITKFKHFSADDMDDGNTITTRLLTLLNVSATKAGKRKRTYEDELLVGEKLNKRKSIQFDDVEKENSAAVSEESDLPNKSEEDVVQESENGAEDEDEEAEQMDDMNSEG